MADDNAPIDKQDPRPMQIPAPAETERTRQKLRVDRNTASLIRRLETLGPGMRVIVVVDVEADGRRVWSLAHVTEAAR